MFRAICFEESDPSRRATAPAPPAHTQTAVRPIRSPPDRRRLSANMGKRQHQKDKMYLTATEWSWLYGGRRPDQRSLDELAARIARLPFNHCCLTLQPVTDPVCNREGYVFEKKNILSFVSKYHCDPITGKKPFSEKDDLIPLNVAKNSDGSFHCPVLFKAFSENSHIVVISVTGNVFSYEAVEELNIKSRNYRDLLTDQPFARKDVIVLQDPMQTDRLNPSQFYHFTQKLKWVDNEEDNAADPSKRLKKMDHVTKETLRELESTFRPSTSKAVESCSKSADTTVRVDRFNAALFSTGKVAASLTSTVMDTHTRVETAAISEDVYKYAEIKKKGYVTLDTSTGPLNLELYCNWTPKTCENFLKLCRKGYYAGTRFHRLIKNFMIQGGDPTGTGTGGNSIWEQPFKDEFVQHLSHAGRGVLSMANSGKNTNKSQFFITFRSCKHLDRKHTIFGKVVGGLETLDKMEKIETDGKDAPKEPIVIKQAVIYVDPFKELDEYIESERSRANQVPRVEKEEAPLRKFRSGVGAFIDLAHVKDNQESAATAAAAASDKKDKKKASKFGDFSSW